MSNTLPENIRRLRKRKRLTQKQLAQNVGYAQSYVSALERGVSAASIAVLEKLSETLEVSVADLLGSGGSMPGSPLETELIPVLNDSVGTSLVAPGKKGKIGLQSRDSLYIPNVLARSSFAVYLSDDSMEPEFSKGDLVVFSLKRNSADGQACLVDTGKGQVLFRTVWALPGGHWRLQPSTPKYAPMVVNAGKGLRMWPAIGRWQRLLR